jgi:hypothetical protein
VVRYNPTAHGTDNDTVQINYNNGVSATNSQRPVTGATVALLDISDANTYDYGTVAVSSSGDKTFTVTNNGGSQASALGGSGLVSPFSFKGGGTFPGTGGTCVNAGTINASANCTIVVAYAPGSGGNHSDSVQVDYNDGLIATNSQRPVIGETEAVLDISDGATYNFGNTWIGGTAVEKTFTVTNNGFSTATGLAGAAFGLADFAFKGGTFPGTGGDCPNGGNLAEAGTCTTVVTFGATLAGARNDIQQINYNDGTGAASSTRDVTGNGQTPATLSISDGATYDYGSVYNKSTNDKTFTVTFTAGDEASVATISESGLAAPYSMPGGYPGGGTCGDPISANCTIIVRYNPQSVSAGDSDIIVLNYTNALGAQTANRDVTGVSLNNPPQVDTSAPGTPANTNEVTADPTFQVLTSSDLDGDTFTIRWLIDGVEQQAPCGGSCTSSNFSPSTTYQAGGNSYTVRAELNDGTDTTNFDWTWNPQEVLNHVVDQTSTAGTAADDYGYAIATGADITGDGVDDFVVGEPQASGGKGVVLIVNGATGAEVCNRTGPDANGWYGRSVDIGVVDGGNVRVVAGGSEGPTTGPGGNRRKGVIEILDSTCSVVDSATGAASDEKWGRAVKIVNDVNADTVPDIAWTSEVLGEMEILEGDNLASVLVSYTGTTGTEWGASLSTMPDLDSDGFEEIIVGVPGDDTGGTDAGRVEIYNTDAATQLGYYNGAAAGDRLGESVVGLSTDATGDAVADILVGAPGANSGDGEVRIIEGENCAACAWALDTTLSGLSASGEAFGSCVASADVNNDGSDDLIIGMKNGDYNALTDNGRIMVFSGLNSENQREYYYFDGAAASDFLGTSCHGGAEFDSGGSNEDFVSGGDGKATSFNSNPI